MHFLSIEENATRPPLPKNSNGTSWKITRLALDVVIPHLGAPRNYIRLTLTSGYRLPIVFFNPGRFVPSKSSKYNARAPDAST